MTDPSYQTFERMTSGRWYIPGPGQDVQREQCWEVLNRINKLAVLDSDELLSILAPGSYAPEVFGPLFIEYGVNTSFGPGCFVNTGTTILDTAPVSIGANTLIGPNCQLITVGHPVNDVQMRRDLWEKGTPITIGDDCWFGAGVHVMPGVTIGDRCVVAAGAVVTKDIPDDSLVMGVPGRVVRTLGGGASERGEIDS
ncbi:sugar O-acetyltransferase [Corynebacterium sp. UBA2622]|uniref:sugar O-acetyltransferase n=1 Tax=Corynebacterium sp. UBA2622 TaxID=1946393 RepID=UPI0025B82DE9|nr:sugar O-acetyltransferase [Corynebacterium sp. UBA2622]